MSGWQSTVGAWAVVVVWLLIVYHYAGGAPW